RCHDGGVLTEEGREYAAFVDELISFRRNVYSLRNDRVAAWKWLGGGGCLARLLGHTAFVDADERLSCLPVEDVCPACLADLGNCLPQPAACVHIHQNDGI